MKRYTRRIYRFMIRSREEFTAEDAEERGDALPLTTRSPSLAAERNASNSAFQTPPSDFVEYLLCLAAVTRG